MDYKKKIITHRVVKIAAVAVGIIAFVMIGVVTYNHVASKTYESSQVIGEISASQSMNASWAKLGDSILTYTQDGANCVSEKGSLIWNRAFELQEPIIDICGETVAITEYNGTVIYIMNSQSELGEITTGMPIKNFCVSENGVVAAVLEDGSTTWIYLYDVTGTELVNFKTTMQDSGYPIEIDLSDDAKLLAVSFITINGIELKSRVAFYNFGEVGQNKSDMLVSGYDYTEAIVPAIEFLQNGSIVAIADNRLMIYEGTEIPLHTAETLINEEIQSVAYSDEYIGLLFYSNDSSVKYNLSLYNTKASLVGNIQFDDYYSEILIQDDQVIIYSENQLSIYRIDGQLIYEEQMGTQISKVLCTSKRNQFIIIYETGMEIIELR
ncbi:MAG: DUF5711 family protein [Eubacteriales bacterium]